MGRNLAVILYQSPDLIPARLKRVALITADASLLPALASHAVTLYRPGDTIPNDVMVVGAVAYATRDLAPANIVAIGQDRYYLLRDTFPYDAAAPLASPRTCVPGPGQLILVQNDGQFSIDGNGLNFSAQATPAWGDLLANCPTQDRTAGLTLLAKLIQTTGYWALCWQVVGGFAPTSADASFYLVNADIFVRFSGDPGPLPVGSLVAGTVYEAALVLRGTGAYLFIRGGVYVNWTLLWVFDALATATLVPQLTSYSGVGSLSREGGFRLIDLFRYDARFATDNGLATSVLTNPIAGATAAHTPDCLLDVTFTWDGVTNLDLYLRYQSDLELEYLTFSGNGNYYFGEKVAGTATDRAVGAHGLANGTRRAVIIAEGNVYKLYLDNTLKFTFTDANNYHLTGAIAKVATGVGGGISSIIAWPRTVVLPGGL